MEFQPPKYKPIPPAQCRVCEAACLCLLVRREAHDLLRGITFHDRINDQAAKWVLFGYREAFSRQGRPVCLCLDCYFNHVERRARACAEFTTITEAEVDDHVALMSKGLHPLPAGETERDRCLRLRAIIRSRQKYYEQSFLQDLIAEDLGLEASELFPLAVESAYNSTKASVIIRVLNVRMAAKFRRVLVSWPAILAYLLVAGIVVRVLYRAGN